MKTKKIIEFNQEDILVYIQELYKEMKTYYEDTLKSLDEDSKLEVEKYREKLRWKMIE